MSSIEATLPPPDLHDGIVLNARGKYAGSCSGYTADAMRRYADARTEQLRAALESARNGLAWYRAECPEADSCADDEMMEEIARALGPEEGEQHG